MGYDLRRALPTRPCKFPKEISLYLFTAVLFCCILKIMKFPIAIEHIYRIIQWVVVILCTALILYLAITEQRFAPEGWGCCYTEEIISEAQAELVKKPLK